jgi:hypothetical protein
MSHQTRQINSFVTVTNLGLLKRAVESISIEKLGTSLVFDQTRTAARYYGTNIDNNPNNVGVIGYARPLTQDEQYSNYEIAVRKDERDVDGHKMTVYDLYGDVNAGDREMQKKISKVFEEYQIAVATDASYAQGATHVEEILNDPTVPEGYRCIEVTVNV